jgi:phosphohistidine phosphatase
MASALAIVKPRQRAIITAEISSKGRLNMRLYLVQHAKAAVKEVDPERSLTEQGRQEIKKVAAFVKPLNLRVDCLWHSGKTRAAQTAEVLAETIKVKEDTTAHDGLGPNDDVSALREELAATDKDVMIVGHLPFLSKLASSLSTGDESANIVAFRNGGVVCLRRGEDSRWQVDWVVTPELLA